ncbi:glycosyltransferase [Aestuariibacter salexigens]|uniref:glycosyltransferase n=1 Tax=Aestuariibacter salexigens TaxID=226010 RepID=UPI00041D27A7|nr:glycosyltransferase [Aestuariibacter salexigens]
MRERMFRMRKYADIVVVSPVPWFPGQELIKLFFPDYRPMPPKMEVQDGVKVYFPRFFSLPLLFRQFDSLFMQRGARKLVKRLVKERNINIIDAHFTYPDGHAATQLAEEVGLPSTITMRGTEVPHSKDHKKLPSLKQAWSKASHVIAVSQSLKDVALQHGVEDSHITVVGNGIDTEQFQELDKKGAKQKLGLQPDAKVIITVGGLVWRKGFHRVIECMPDIQKEHPNLHYLIVGGASLEGNIEAELREQSDKLNLTDAVTFCGAKRPEELSLYLSAADVFVLATANEGWANVLLESLACGTPVVATDVGGNKEVITDDTLGAIVPFDDREALGTAITGALHRNWDTEHLLGYAQQNHWDNRITQLNRLFKETTPYRVGKHSALGK